MVASGGNVSATDVTLIVEGTYSNTTPAFWNGIATNIGGSIQLHVPCIELRRTAIQEDKQAPFGSAKCFQPRQIAIRCVNRGSTGSSE